MFAVVVLLSFVVVMFVAPRVLAGAMAIAVLLLALMLFEVLPVVSLILAAAGLTVFFKMGEG